ncbi:hypothetical protein ACFV13_29315 [Streptomyces bauhiniae]
MPGTALAVRAPDRQGPALAEPLEALVVGYGTPPDGTWLEALP